MKHNHTSSFLPSPMRRLVVVGVGALGSSVCSLLLECGYKDVLLIDPDCVAPHNVPLSRVFQAAGAAAVGQPKVAVIEQWARRAALPWQSRQAEIADVGLGELAAFDVLLSCPDNALARAETAFAARSLALPMLDAGVQSLGIAEGRVSWFAPEPEAACYLCGLADARRGELLAYALAPSLGCALPADGLMGPMTGAPAAVQMTARAVLEVLEGGAGMRGKGSFALRLRAEPGAPTAGERIELPRSCACPWHALAAPERLCALPYERPLRDLLGPHTMLELPWPVCLQARCGRCGQVDKPMRRAAFVRRAMLCPGCGCAGALEPLATLGTLAATHPLAARSLRQLGLPDRHLYHLRRTVHATEPRTQPDGCLQQRALAEEPQ